MTSTRFAVASLAVAALFLGPVRPALARDAKAKEPQTVHLTVTQEGFEPSTVSVKAGQPVKLIVTRKVARTCATDIVMRDFGVNQPLPLDKPVTVTVTPAKRGSYRFSCAMNMVAGTLKAE